MNYLRANPLDNYNLIVPEEIEPELLALLYSQHSVMIEPPQKHLHNPHLQYLLTHLHKQLLTLLPNSFEYNQEEEVVQLEDPKKLKINEELAQIQKFVENVKRKREVKNNSKRKLGKRKKELQYSREMQKLGISQIEVGQGFMKFPGAVELQQSIKLKRTIFRITRNNYYYYSKQSQTHQYFLMLCPLTFKEKIFILLQPFRIQLIPLKEIDREEKEIQYLEEVIATQEQNQFQENKKLFQCKQKLDMIKCIYDVTPQRVMGYSMINMWVKDEDEEQQQGWCTIPEQVYRQIQIQKQINKVPKQTNQTLQKGLNALKLPTIHPPVWSYCSPSKTQSPTYIQQNPDPIGPITQPSNNIICAYGIPRIGQINPATFATVIFPFFFGIMFGDIGHGFIFMIVGLFTNYKAFFILMGFFSMYAGFIYNQCFGLKLRFFDTCINEVQSPCVYPVGMDYSWEDSPLQLNYTNSFKMKLSMLIAFVHMFFGLFIRLINNVHYKEWLNIFIDTLPRMILMLTTVGFMCLLIVVKWLTPFDDPSLAPSIITIMMEMYLGNQQNSIPVLELIPNQAQICTILKLTTFCTAVFFLMTPPVIQPKQLISLSIFIFHKFTNYEQIQQEQAQQESPLEGVEYVLSILSCTTSYLRLFALSLAHQKLSQLLLSMLTGFLGQSPFYVQIAVSILFVFGTLGLIAIDSLQCVMHTIRLIWVEWMSRFWRGQGRRWVTFGVQKDKK